MILNGLDLFSGIGGITLALNEWVRPVAYCEIDPYCQSVLLSRMSQGHLPKAPIWDDIRTLSGNMLPVSPDIIYGGFPCQGVSVAGLGKGLEDERSGLFFEIVRLAKEIMPSFLFLENVPAITSRGGTTVVRTLTTLGYDCRWCVISAASVGALHRRERWFLLAHSDGERELQSEGSQQTKRQWISDSSSYGTSDEWREAVSSMGKLSHGIPYRMDRLRALGNAVVPIQANEAFKILTGIK